LSTRTMVGEKGVAQRLGSGVLGVGRWAVAKDSGGRARSLVRKGEGGDGTEHNDWLQR
jgi:hypothetical protein